MNAQKYIGDALVGFIPYVNSSFNPWQCEKLAILRQKLVARRKKRINEIGSENKENNARLNRSAGYTMQAAGTPPDSLQLRISRDAEPQVQLQQMSLEDDATAASPFDSIDQSQASGLFVIKDSSNNLEDEESVVEIELIKCECCKRSFAPKVYEKHVDDDGQPKCLTQMSKKRAVFNSAKVRYNTDVMSHINIQWYLTRSIHHFKARIANNDNLNRDEQMQIIQSQKKVAKELAKKKTNGGVSKKSKRSSKWKEESNALREAMKANRLIAKAEREGKPAHYYL